MGGKYYARCKVISQDMIAERIYSLWLQAEDIAAAAIAGQFVNLYTEDGSKLLPRPVSLCEIRREEGKIRLVYRAGARGTGTDSFSRYREGDEMTVFGPLGNGFPLEACAGRTAVLLGGGIGIPPMLALAAALNGVRWESGEKPRVEAVLGYNDEIFLAEEFRPYGKVTLASLSGSYGVRGTVLDALKAGGIRPDIIYACGPAPMLRAVKEYARQIQADCWISMEERMACGIGACLGCVCQSTQVDGHSMVKNKRICKEGPVFPAESIVI